MYSPRLYKYRDSYVLYIPLVHAFGSVLLTHTVLVQTHIHDVSAPVQYTKWARPSREILMSGAKQNCKGKEYSK